MKRKPKNKKTLELTLPKSLTIGMSDACFRVKDDDGMIGELQVSKGSLVWFPRDAKRGYRLPWRRFDDLACKYGRRCESR